MALKDDRQANVIQQPIIIVHQVAGGKQEYLIWPEVLDRQMKQPRISGVLLSDLLDHLVAAYQMKTGKPDAEIRSEIMRVLLEENKLKAANPTRGDRRSVLKP